MRPATRRPLAGTAATEAGHRADPVPTGGRTKGPARRWGAIRQRRQVKRQPRRRGSGRRRSRPRRSRPARC
jgi:hypothetical protein